MTRSLQLIEDKIRLTCDYEERHIAKLVPGYTWNKKAKRWDYPLNNESYQGLIRNFPGIQVDPKLIQAIQAISDREATVRQTKMQGWEGVEPTEPMPIKTKPFGHQLLGYELACKILGVFKSG